MLCVFFPSSCLFAFVCCVSRLVYDCTASPVFSKRWVSGRVVGSDGVTLEKCTCLNCIMYTNSSPTLSSSQSYASINTPGAACDATPPQPHPHPPAGTPPPQQQPQCNGSWLVEVRSFYTPTSPIDTTLVFESRFESGNLRTAFQVSESEYDLTIRPDFNTTHHSQWFYFSIRNTRMGRTYKFNIINFVKPSSLFNSGMRPLFYSKLQASSSSSSSSASSKHHNDNNHHHHRPKGWFRSGDNICYYQNHLKRGSSRQRYYYTLSFTFEASDDNDTIYLAYCFPYTYTMLNTDLHRLESDPNRSRYVRRRTLCRTLAGNACDMLSITDYEEGSPDEMRSRKGIVYTARVHPGESNSSWIMRGLLDFLTGPSDIARQLRRQFIFKCVPMLNPDGVVNGNYRCSLAGVDLNRQWKTPSPTMHPTIFATKQMIFRLARVRDVLMCVDLHGHSRKFNIFVYGCPPPALNTTTPSTTNGTPAAGNGATAINGTNQPASNTVPIDLSAAPSVGVVPPPSSSPTVTAVSGKKKKSKSGSRHRDRDRDRDAILADPRRLCERVFPKLLAEEPNPTPQQQQQAIALQQQQQHQHQVIDSHDHAVRFSPHTTATSAPAFSMRNCSFTISRGKESTARVVLWREIGLLNSFTLEASFAGANMGSLKGLHFDARHLEQMGIALGKALAVYTDPRIHEATRMALCDLTPIGESLNALSGGGGGGGAAGEDDSDDSSDSPDESAIPLTVGRSDTVKRVGKKKKSSKAAALTAAKAAAASTAAASAGAAASSSTPTSRASPSSSPPPGGSTSAASKGGSSSATASSYTRRRTIGVGQDRLNQLWQQAQQTEEDEATRRRKKRALEKAASLAAAASAAAASTPPALTYFSTPGLGISSYYRGTNIIQPSRSIASGGASTSASVAMIVEEEEEREKLRAAAAARAASPSGPYKRTTNTTATTTMPTASPTHVGPSVGHRARPKSAYPIATATGSFGVASSPFLIDTASPSARRPQSAVGSSQGPRAGSDEPDASPAASPSPSPSPSPIPHAHQHQHPQPYSHPLHGRHSRSGSNSHEPLSALARTVLSSSGGGGHATSRTASHYRDAYHGDLRSGGTLEYDRGAGMAYTTPIANAASSGEDLGTSMSQLQLRSPSSFSAANGWIRPAATSATNSNGSAGASTGAPIMNRYGTTATATSAPSAFSATPAGSPTGALVIAGTSTSAAWPNAVPYIPGLSMSTVTSNGPISLSGSFGGLRGGVGVGARPKLHTLHSHPQPHSHSQSHSAHTAGVTHRIGAGAANAHVDRSLSPATTGPGATHRQRTNTRA